MAVHTEIIEAADLASLGDRVDRWLDDLVDDAVDYGARRLKVHAPGGIDALVVTDGPQYEPDVGAIEGVAGVTPDPVEESENPRGFESSPADYPFYVDVGTGVHGERGDIITAFPGDLMGPILYKGRMIYIRFSKGQEAQLYSDRAAEDLYLWLDERLVSALPGLR